MLSRAKSAFGGKKVLVISYLFPPVGGGGVLRMTKFAKFLPCFGYTPFVLTAKKHFYPLRDLSLLAEIPTEVKIERISYFEPGFWSKTRIWQSFLAYVFYPWFLFPDQRAFWFLPALRQALKIIQREKIRIIFTSSSSITDHLIALVLKKITGAKWAADFRDEWTTSHYVHFPTPFHRFLAAKIEKQILKNADAVTTVSGHLTKIYQKILGKNYQKFQTITNGFDPEDFNLGKIAPKQKKYCEILYAGTLYGSRQVAGFRQAVKELKIKNLKVTFLGQDKYLSHQKAIKKMCQADILLLILSPEDTLPVVTGKIYEYLAARRPILALAPAHSGAAILVKKMKLGEVAPPNNTQKIKDKILTLYQKWLANKLAMPSIDIEKYNRKNLTKKLANIFDKLEQNSYPSATWHGHKIKLCFVGNLCSPQNINLVNYFKVKKDYEIYFITYKKNQIDGVETYFVPHQESHQIIAAIYRHYLTIRRIRKIVQKIKPDIIHGQSLNFAGIWASFTRVRPLVVTAWGSDVINYEKFIVPERYLIRRALKKADLIIGTSGETKKRTNQILGYSKPFYLIHFGVDLNVFKPQSALKLRRKLKLKNKKIIFCPRAIKPLYNIDVLIDTLAMVVKKYPSSILALIKNNFTTEYYQDIKIKIQRLNLSDKVIFLPPVANTQMVDYYNLAEVVVSIPNSDGCSVSVLEAMACQKKIIVSDLPYVKDWLAKNNLWRVSPRDVVQTAEMILKVLKVPPKEFAPTGRRNRAMVATRAEIKKNFAKLEEQYQNLIFGS